MNKLLIIFIKNPEIGRVKTRIAKALGDDAALAIYLRLIAHTHEVVEPLECDKAIYYSAFVDTEDNWSNKKYRKHLQKGHDLGEKMKNAFDEGLTAGYDHVCLIGSDIYELTGEVIESAFAKLQTCDVVVGPAKDGGYYLIGMKKLYSEVFNLERWSTPNVFSETIKRIEQAKLTYRQTRLLSDIDTADDIKGTNLENIHL